MEKRFDTNKLVPEIYNKVLELEKSIQASSLEKTHLELIKLRASQINGCAYCINMHTEDALKLGETVKRIALLNAWRDTDLFSAEEKVILAMTEEVTLIHQDGLSDSTYDKASKYFDKEYIALIIMTIITINAWNRIAISSKEIVR